MWQLAPVCCEREQERCEWVRLMEEGVSGSSRETDALPVFCGGRCERHHHHHHHSVCSSELLHVFASESRCSRRNGTEEQRRIWKTRSTMTRALTVLLCVFTLIRSKWKNSFVLYLRCNPSVTEVKRACLRFRNVFSLIYCCSKNAIVALLGCQDHANECSDVPSAQKHYNACLFVCFLDVFEMFYTAELFKDALCLCF